MLKSLKLRKHISIGILFAFLGQGLSLPQAQAASPARLAESSPSRASGDFRLPAPGVRVGLSPEFNPPVLKGIKVHPDNPFRFDFILDTGDVETPLMASLRNESTKLIKYFLASLTIPEKDLWVNLSPYEKDRIIPQSFGLTEMGRDLLAEDYMLKQITASLIYPEDEIGKKFWKRIYQEAFKKFGTTHIPVNTFNKVWIIPDQAVVYENAKAGTAYVVESKLKVMLEQDYLALEKNNEKHSGMTDVSNLASQIVREIVIPELTKEVNEGKNFSQLRQVYNSLILATWYKKKIKDSILSQVYADKNKVIGININDPQEKQKIYERYLQAFKKGVYNYIKEEADLISNQIIPRKYFSGGASLAMTAIGPHAVFKIIDFVHISNPRENSQVVVTVDLAMNSGSFGHDVSNAGPRFTTIPEGGTILAFGTSSTKGVLKHEYSYPSLLEKILGHRVINAGVPGERIINVGNKYEQEIDGVTRLTDLLAKEHPSLLILWHGRTDWFDVKADDLVENSLNKMILDAKNHHCQVLLVGVSKPDTGEDASVYRKVAEANGVPYLSGIEQGILGQKQYMFDRLHTNSQGNLLYAKRIAEFLWVRGALSNHPDISLTVPPSNRVEFQQFEPPLYGNVQTVGPDGVVHFTVGFGTEDATADKVLLHLKLRYEGGWSNNDVSAVIEQNYNHGWYLFKAILPPDVIEYTPKTFFDGNPISDSTKIWIWSQENITVNRVYAQSTLRFKPIPKGGTILMVGSSSLAGVVEPSYSPPAFLKRMTGHEVINAGVPGEKIIQSTGHGDEGISKLQEELDRYKPSLLVFWHGRNDWFEGIADEVVEGALNHMIEEAKKRNIQVLLLGSSKPNSDEEAPVYRKVAQRGGIPYFNGIYKGVLSNKDLMYDELHANAEGNLIFARRIAEFLWERGALSEKPNTAVIIPKSMEVDFKDLWPIVHQGVQYVGPDGAVFFTVGFGEPVAWDQVTMLLHYQIPDDPDGNWGDDIVEGEIVNKYPDGYYRLKAILPPGVNAYTVKVSSDGKLISDPSKHWVELDSNIRVFRDWAQLGVADSSKQMRGGIDLTPAPMNVETKMDSREQQRIYSVRTKPSIAEQKTGNITTFRGNDIVGGGNDRGIQFHLDPAMLQQLQNAPGFVPVIINIRPMRDLRGFLGLKVD